MNGSSISVPPSNFNRFLHAPIGEEQNGTPLSVLSALARVGVDPWEEAARLATMSKALAGQALTSTLNKVATRDRDPAEVEALAARLVQLLPQGVGGQRAESIHTVKSEVNYPILWLLWLSVSIAISLSSPHHRGTATDAALTSSKANVVSSPSSNHSFRERAPLFGEDGGGLHTD